MELARRHINGCPRNENALANLVRFVRKYVLLLAVPVLGTGLVLCAVLFACLVRLLHPVPERVGGSTNTANKFQRFQFAVLASA